MKAHSKYLLVVLLVFTSVNCSKEDDSASDPEPTTPELLIGKWFIKEINNVEVPEGCLDQSYYHFLDGQRMVSERFNSDIDSDCFSLGIYASPYTLNGSGEVTFEIQELIGITTVTVVIIEISTSELTGTFQFGFGGAEYKLIKDL